MASSSRRQLEHWLGQIDVPAGSRVIDIGGAQKPIKGRTKSWGASDYVILDLPKPHENNLDGGIQIWGDIQNTDFSDDVENDLKFDLFDIVFCLEVSEYWTRPLDALKNIASFLRKDGLLYISFHFIYPHHEPFFSDCLRYTLPGAEKLLNDAGFGIIGREERWADNGENLLDFYDLEGMKPTKGFFAHGAIGWLITAKKL